MSRIIRTLAVSGAAAAALMGAASTATADSPEAAVTAVQSTVHRAAGTPVTLPDGRTLHVQGLDSVSYRSDDSHRTAVVTLADGIGTGLSGNAPAQQGAVPEVNGVGTGVGYQPGQVQTQAGAGGISTLAVAALALSIVLFFGIKSGKVSKGWCVVCLMLGVLLSGTVVGPMVSQLTGSSVTMFGNFWAGM